MNECLVCCKWFFATCLLKIFCHTQAKNHSYSWFLLFLQFLEPLELCYRSLCVCGDRPIADGSLLDFLRQVSTFGLSLVRLDIRQESERHTDVLDAITKHFTQMTDVKFYINSIHIQWCIENTPYTIHIRPQALPE